MTAEALFIDEETCTGCGWCETVCPEDALRAWGYLTIDREKCTACGLCVDHCPTDSLSIE